MARNVPDNSDDDAINTEERIWDLTQNINVKGVWYGCKHAIPAMRNVRTTMDGHHGVADLQNKADPSKGLHIGGSIINVASFVAILGAATPQLACKLSGPTFLAYGNIWQPDNQSAICSANELSIQELTPDTASKGAVLAMTRELAMVHAREGIRVNALCP